MDHADLVDDALARQAAYAEAGADGFFVPGVSDPALISKICERARLPINVMMMGHLHDIRDKIRTIAPLGVSRISFGPAPYISLTSVLEREASAFY